MITKDFAVHFADDWIDVWNAHDLERILAHYTDDFEMTSPVIASRMGVASGTLKGKEKVGEYWSKGLAAFPGLKFTPRAVTFSLNSVALFYESSIHGQAIEWFSFDAAGLVVKAIAHYQEPR